MYKFALAIVPAIGFGLTSEVTAQALDLLLPGDSVRFEVPREVTFTDPGGRPVEVGIVNAVVAGRVLSIGEEMLAVRVGGTEKEYPITELDEVSAHRAIENPAARGFMRGAIIGGGLFGAAIGGLALCNPGLYGGGCQGGTFAQVASATLEGALVGALLGGILGAAGADDHQGRWVRVRATPMGGNGAVALDLRIPMSR